MKLQQIQAELRLVKDELTEIYAEKTAAEADLAKFRGDRTRLYEQLYKISPNDEALPEDDRSRFAAAKRALKELPIINGFNPHHAIQYDWPKDLEIHQVDIRKRKAEDLFRKGNVKALIHMGIMHDPRMSAEEHHFFNVLGTAKALDYCAKHGVEKLVVLSSANVYGPHPNNTNFLTEDAPLMAAARFGEIRDLVEVDILAQSFIWKHPEVETVILRPVHIVGPTIRNAASTSQSLEPS